MKFYVIDRDGETIGCELTIKAAHTTAQSYGIKRGDYRLTMIDAQVNAETVRRLLGDLGGFANESKEVSQ